MPAEVKDIGVVDNGGTTGGVLGKYVKCEG